MLSLREHHHKIAESALSWWRDAGVEYVTDGQAINWLDPVVKRQPPTRIAPSRPVESLSGPPVASVALAEWPSDLSALKAAIGSLPGSNYGARYIAPKGEIGAIALVIGDFPEEAEISAGSFGAGSVGLLMTNMLLAAELVPDLIYQTALAHSRPASASLPKDDLEQLAAFARHQIALVNPQVVVLFGTAACEALLGEDLLSVRGQKRYINHLVGKTAAVATFHPRTLMAQPQLKAQAWRDLQMLVRKDYL